MTEENKEPRWYVAHTNFGYENKVKSDLEKTVENRKLQDLIFEMAVPLEDVVEVKNGVKRVVQKKMLPGYVLVNMILNDNTWYIVRNTRGVSGFVGPGGKPVPLTDEEIERLHLQKTKVEIGFKVGDLVTIVTGAWEGTTGAIRSINESKQTLTLNIEMFGRETPVELGFADVKQL